MYNNKLENALDKNISDICKNKFHGNNYNHCAHFVSHIADIKFSYQCREYKGGNKQPANIRVHEIFAQCPRVGKRSNMDLTREQLVFVTKEANVNIDKKEMINIPQKHVGIYSDGYIYHYANTKDKVIKQTIDDFFNYFQSIYSGHQELFFGYFPGEATQLNVDFSGINAASVISFEIENKNNRWYARPVGENNESWFLVGKEIRNTSADYHGIFVPVSEYYGPQFKASEYIEKYDHWANLLELTGYCESRNYFNLINTYDRAKFTFGFYQLAAHTPNDNFVLFLRDLIEENITEAYFPELKLINGKVHRVDKDGSVTDLERIMETGPNNQSQLQLLMNYLNPNRRSIDPQEILNTARLMHMSSNLKKSRDIQVDRSAKILETKMARYGRKYNLDGEKDTICAVICDIHHQGRASSKRVREALESENKLHNLIHINSNYKSRSKALEKKIEKMHSDNALGKKLYIQATNEFKDK